MAGWVGMDSRIRLHGGGLSVGKTEGGAGSRIRLHGGRFSAGGRGWVPASAEKTDGGEGGRMVDRMALRVGDGMGPRIREDNGGGWVSASVFTRASSSRGDGDGFPHPRGQRGGDGFPHPSSRGQALRGGTGMGPRIREDNGGRLFAGTTEAGSRVGMGSRIRLHGGRLFAGGRGMRGTHPRGQRVGERVPASVFTGAGSRWEDTGGCTPILTFPPEGGRERRGVVGSLRFYGGGHSAGTMWMGERGGRDGSPHTRGQRMGEREEG